uniref:Uncharacterized protein n=1 Tax=Arundo donax TaxID=35708 RepID=A0A0A9CCA0_ARUDO
MATCALRRLRSSCCRSGCVGMPRGATMGGCW